MYIDYFDSVYECYVVTKENLMHVLFTNADSHTFAFFNDCVIMKDAKGITTKINILYKSESFKDCEKFVKNIEFL